MVEKLKLRLRMGLELLVIIVAVVIAAAFFIERPNRPPGPPPNAVVSMPFGAVDIDNLFTEGVSKIEQSLVDSFGFEAPGSFDPDHDNVKEYPLLALSGGGSNGAFGAGLLCGWTQQGTRPDFKVVTGVSTGAFQALLAFLGPEYDTQLKEVYTLFGGEDIYHKKSVLGTLFGDSSYDQSGLKACIEHYVTEDMLAAVAQKHAAGYRLYVGTTNLDTTEFVIWDLGEVASSGRPDALSHFRNILIASSAIPVLFEPVYFEVESEGKTYHEMHVDGSAFAQVFFRGFLLEFEDALDDMGMTTMPEIDLYVIRNGRMEDFDTHQCIPGRTVAIASRTIASLFQITLDASIFRLYVLAERNGMHFNLAAIPDDADIDLDPFEFALEPMQRLFDLGYQLAEQGDPWTELPPKLDPDELMRLK